MKENEMAPIYLALFPLIGAMLGLLYYRFVGCYTGSCPLGSNPLTAMGYMALAGWILAGGFGCCCGSVYKD